MDLLQGSALYPLLDSESEMLGLEIAGAVLIQAEGSGIDSAIRGK